MSAARKANWIALLWTTGVSLALAFLPMNATETDVVYTAGRGSGPELLPIHGRMTVVILRA